MPDLFLVAEVLAIGQTVHGDRVIRQRNVGGVTVVTAIPIGLDIAQDSAASHNEGLSVWTVRFTPLVGRPSGAFQLVMDPVGITRSVMPPHATPAMERQPARDEPAPRRGALEPPAGH